LIENGVIPPLLLITSPTVDRLPKVIHFEIQQKICSKVIVKDPLYFKHVATLPI